MNRVGPSVTLMRLQLTLHESDGAMVDVTYEVSVDRQSDDSAMLGHLFSNVLKMADPADTVAVLAKMVDDHFQRADTEDTGVSPDRLHEQFWSAAHALTDLRDAQWAASYGTA